MVIVIHIQHIIFSDKCFKKIKGIKSLGRGGFEPQTLGMRRLRAHVWPLGQVIHSLRKRLSLKIKQTSLRDLKNGATLHLRLQPQAPSIQISELSQLSTICNDVNMKLALNSLTILNM